jgi:hypothetical protein
MSENPDMVAPKSQSVQKPFDVLRRFARQRAPAERCELCGLEIPHDHEHMVEIANRKLLCSCNACAILFSGQASPRYRRVPRDVRWLKNFAMSEAQWESLSVPINLAFFFYSTPAGRVGAFYPSPAGPTESLLPLESWEDLLTANPVLGKMQPDVEALLVNRVGDDHNYYLVPIDKCYELVGLIRLKWAGLSGGTEVWREITRFFNELKQRSAPGASAHG